METPQVRVAPETIRLLWAAFAVQVLGRLLDFWWHAAHAEFESGGNQLRAHWLVWIGTVLLLIVAVRALRSGVEGPQRTGFLTVLIANGLYIPIAIAHFIQHVNHQEVDWAHAGLAITNLGSVVGVFIITLNVVKHRRRKSQLAD